MYVNIGNVHSLRAVDSCSILQESKLQAKSIQPFKNHLNEFWSIHAKLYDYEIPSIPGTGNSQLLIGCKDEDLVFENRTGCYEQY